MELIFKKRGKLIIFFTIVIALLFSIGDYMVNQHKFFLKDNEKEKMTSESKYQKVLLIGIDGMDPKIMEKLMSDGLLPNFEKLKDKGSFSKLETIIPPESPVAWASIATGTNPGKHNIFDFIERNPKTYLPYLTIIKEKHGVIDTEYEPPIKGIPFWKITSKENVPTTVIRWPATFPPDEVNGKMLSGLGVPEIRGLLNDYRFYTSGNIDKNSKGAEKVIKVEKNEDGVKTKIFGPRTSRGGEPISVPILVNISKNKVIVHVQDSLYEVKVGEWSNWIKIKFKVDFFREVTGIGKVYLESIEPEFNMYLTSIQLDPENPIISFTYPKEYSKELANDIGLYYTLGMPEDTKALNENRISNEIFLEQCEEIEMEREKMFWHEFKDFSESEKGVFAFVFDTSDRIQHNFWDEKVLDFENKDNELSINKAVKDYYLKKDKFLGEVMEKIDNETALIIFSDHGFTSFERSVNINTWLVENGFMTLTKNPNEKESGELFKFVDWSKTKAYSVGFFGVYINLKGREKEGIVGEKDKSKIVNEIIEKLKNLTDTDLKNGKKVITNLYKREDVYSGAYIENAPDIIIGFEPGYRMSNEGAIGGINLEIISDNKEKYWRGDHLVDKSHVPGVLFTNFKIKIKNETPSVLDIAPTTLSLLRIETPEEIDGKSLVGKN